MNPMKPGCVASTPREFAGDDVEDGREDQAEEGDADHAEEDGGAQRLTHVGGSTGLLDRLQVLFVNAPCRWLLFVARKPSKRKLVWLCATSKPMRSNSCG